MLRLDFCPDGKSILASGGKSSLLVEGTSGTVIHTFQTYGNGAHSYRVEAAAQSPNGELFATGSNGSVILWNVSKGETIRRLSGFNERGICQIHGLAFSPDSGRIVGCADDDRFTAIVLERG